MSDLSADTDTSDCILARKMLYYGIISIKGFPTLDPKTENISNCNSKEVTDG
jgi:hypothetical protein